MESMSMAFVLLFSFVIVKYQDEVRCYNATSCGGHFEMSTMEQCCYNPIALSGPSSYRDSTAMKCNDCLSVPGVVQNVRVFLYRPTTDTSIRTALVTWDDLKFVKQFSVNVYNSNGSQLPNLYTPELYLRNSYSVYALSFGGEVSFPLIMGQSYEVEVVAKNDAGSGLPSSRISFTMTENGTAFPWKVLSVGSSGFMYFGPDIGFNKNLSVVSMGPIVVDTIDRVAYWFDHTLNLIYTQSLNSGGVMTPFLMMPRDTTLVSLGYDWIEKLVYMSRLNTVTRRLELIRVNIFDVDRQENVFPSLQDTIPINSTVKSVMNPFTGFFYWAVTTPEPVAVTTLYQIDLRIRNATSYTPIPLSSNLTPALTLNPLTGELIVCDKTSGNILGCQPDTQMCSVLVSRTKLEEASQSSYVGLPASDIEYGGKFLYWTDKSGIFVIDLSEPNLLITISNVTQSSYSLTALSPEQQILPADTTCLAPEPNFLTNRIVFNLERTRITNTTLVISWDINPLVTLRPGCDAVVFSTSPYIYYITNRKNIFLSTERITSRRQGIELSNLLPYTNYFIQVEARNQYRSVPPIISYFIQYQYLTLEGVPDSPRQVTHTVLGTSSVFLEWMEPTQIQGNRDNLTYIVTILNTSTSKGPAPNIRLNNNPPGSMLTIQVLANNGVLNSSIVPVSVQLWPVPPRPVVNGTITNTFIVVSVRLPDASFSPIQKLAIVACEFSRANINPDGTCSCSIILLVDDDFVTVEDFPSSYTFNISQLMFFTKYCIQAVGKYASEITAGMSLEVTTETLTPGKTTTVAGNNNDIIFGSTVGVVAAFFSIISSIIIIMTLWVSRKRKRTRASNISPELVSQFKGKFELHKAKSSLSPGNSVVLQGTENKEA